MRVPFALRLSVVACLAALAPVQAQVVPPDLHDEARLDRLLSQMTLEDKINLIRGGAEPPESYQGQAGYLPGVPRLGVPSLRLADGPPGLLTRVPAQAETATMGVAATWDRQLAAENGIVIGREARSLGIDVVLQPFINLDRDITFTRGFNTFGEDPYLTGQMGAAEVRGIQAQGVMAEAKHYIGYDTESYNVFIDPQTLHEVYLAPFADVIDAGVASIMCSYNRISGDFACGNSKTLKTILKSELGFKGFVTSDWGAVHNVRFLSDGLDVEMPGELAPTSPLAALAKSYFETEPSSAPASAPNAAALAGMFGGTIPEEPHNDEFDMGGFPRDFDPLTLGQAITNGTISESTVTAAARRVLYEMDRFGYLDGRQKHTITAQDIDANAQVIERTSEEAAVLLKNDANSLPLRGKNLNSLALIGPTAGQVAAIGMFGERSPGIPARQVSPLDAMRQLAPDAKILYAADDDMTGMPVPANLLSHDGKPGLMRKMAGMTSLDATLDFTVSNHSELPPNSSGTWTGNLTVPTSGTYWLYLQVLGGRGVLSVNGKVLARTSAFRGMVHGDIQHASHDSGLPTTDGLDNVRQAIDLQAGSQSITVELTPDSSNTPAQIRLSWMTPDARAEAHAQAIAAAKTAHCAVVFLWTRGKPVFRLPGDQDKLIDEIAKVNPNTIVVLNTSQPIAMPWLSKVKGVLEMWWPGDEGGWATANLLLGTSSPSGHLPITWAKSLDDYAPSDPSHLERSSKGVGGKTTFSEGIFVGYRWFDSRGIAPLFPFGFGLSYSDFWISDVHAKRSADGGATVSMRIRNVGAMAADVVPQLYLGAPTAPVPGAQFANNALVGFERVRLASGETKEVTTSIAPRAFQYWSESDHAWKFATGLRSVRVGLSSRALGKPVNIP